MSVEILDGSTVRSFVEDEGAFNSSVDGRFAALDADHDGLLTFDRDGSGKVDRQEFRAEMREVMLMLAVANGLGFLPVQMVLEEGSFLKVAVDSELGQLARAASSSSAQSTAGTTCLELITEF
ncbi:hypothetical protein BAE44_0005052 [Dichanthelium oligosanthes]|uniref:EF-hand domain-containing protein n=1 Tax=Dichanthelium oligosanthes TaxID=888268 RepID=A0A1E5W924_9POAL|nr:hypothetical protein BAE44_0005052 [Dichanthelium oligosanthes]